MNESYCAPDIARMLGVSLDTFYRTREWRHEHDALPRPISERGRLRFEKTGIDAWFTRYHPLRPQALSNDVFLPPPPMTDDEHRARLAAAYGRHTAPA